MKAIHGLPWLGSIVLVLTGCVGARSTASRAPGGDFAQWPAEVQQSVLAGQITTGFTREQVQAALGRPTYKSVLARESPAEIWGYADSRPRRQYAFRSAATASFANFAKKPLARSEPAFLVFFDHEGRVLSVNDTWW